MDGLFGLLTVLPLVCWGAMLLFPRLHFTRLLVTSPWTFIVAGGIQLLLIAAGLAAGAVPTKLALAELARLADQDWFLLATWSHLLFLDLFAGIWIFRDAKYWGINPGPYLLATVLTGPVGLGVYLFMRRRRQQHDPVKTLN